MEMPILRYFVYVGGALLALLFVCDAVLPKEPALATNVAAADHPLIRIHSERKWPKPIVFDTSMPRIAPVVVASNATAPAATADIAAKARLREAFAQLPEPQTGVAEPKTPQATKVEAKPQPQPKRRVAKARTAPPRPLMLVAQQPRFGLFDTTW
jgi:hypothetical protein